MSWQDDIQRANLAILNGRFDDATRILKQIRTTEQAGRRAKAHFEASVDIYQGRYAEARAKLQAALDTYGENVSLLRDLIACQYNLKDMMGFRRNLTRLENLLTEIEPKLSVRALYEAELMVGKFLEEEARLIPAIRFYERALARSDKPAQYVRALIQKSRWHALYEPVPQLSGFYRELISIGPDQFTRDLRIELEHSLMLMELRLVGEDHAWQRFEVLENEIDEIDQRLMVFDFVEGLMVQDLPVRSAVIEKMKSFKDLELFETFLLKLAQGKLEPAEVIQEFVLLASQLPWASFLRLLCITANRDELLPVREELQRKIHLIIKSLDRESQVLWAARLKQSFQAAEIRVDFSSQRRSLSIHGKRIDLSKKKMGLQLIEGLMDRSMITVDDAIRLLWQSSFSPEHYHRLRMGIHRLNTLIHETAGLGKIIEVDSQHVRLRPEVKLRLAEDGAGSDLGIIGI